MPIYHPTNEELIQAARATLDARLQRAAEQRQSVPFVQTIHMAAGGSEERRQRSLQTCHRYSLYERSRYPRPRDTGAFVPQLSQTLETDPNLTDGARRVARVLAAVIYRQNRAGRFTEITVTYLMKAVKRSRRTVQRYLRLLEREGYVTTMVVRGSRSKLCTGLLIALCSQIFPRHHRAEWPLDQRKSAVPKESLNYRFKHRNGRGRGLLTVHQWSRLCMNSVFRAYMKTDPLGVTVAHAPAAL